jgi:hypothetical protein
MRKLLAPLLLGPLLAGCTDSLGLDGGDCSAAMTQVRRSEGRPPDLVQGPEEVQGDFTEVWTYYEGSAGRRYSFRWGTSVRQCVTEGPAPVSRVVVKTDRPTLP